MVILAQEWSTTADRDPADPARPPIDPIVRPQWLPVISASGWPVDDLDLPPLAQVDPGRQLLAGGSVSSSPMITPPPRLQVRYRQDRLTSAEIRFRPPSR
jgi:hypothetical protein